MIVWRFKFSTSPSLCFALAGLLFVLTVPTPFATVFLTAEQEAYDRATSELLKNAVSHGLLGRHGELILPNFSYSYRGVGETGWVHVLKRDDGNYDLAAFIYPKRYYYGRISASGDITYHPDADLPPGVTGDDFSGPLKWPFLDNQGKPTFERPQKATVVANMAVLPLPQVEGVGVRGVFYACMDNSFYMFKGKEVLSPFALLLLEYADKKRMDLVSPDDRETPILSIVDGGWTDSYIVFRRNADGSPLERELRFPWPYLDSKGKPTLPDTPRSLHMAENVLEGWETYDKTGAPLGCVVSPAPRP